MKKNFVFSVIIVLISTLLFGCSQKNVAKDSFDAYIKAWNKEDYSSMYKIISSDSKKTISKKDFVQKYTNIYDGIELSKITITPNYPKSFNADSDGKIAIPFTVTMDTVAGKINFTDTAYMVKETVVNAESWGISWSNSMILKDLKADEKIRVAVTKGNRGEILDKNGAPLAQNGTISEIGIVPDKLGSNASNSINQIAQTLNITADSISKKLSASYVQPDMFIPIDDISKDDTSKTSSLSTITGVVIKDKSARVYPLKESASQLTGYVQTISSEELSKLKNKNYTKDSIIGKAGLEKIYEDQLKATDGGEIYILDKNGNKRETIAKKDAQNGKTIKLTIDATMQTALYNELKDDAGAGVILQPKTGETLALVSTPSYDPNNFVLGMSSTQWNALNNDAKKPLLNRFQSTFAPGSAFKPITAAMGLTNGTLNANTARSISGLKWQKDSSWGSYYVTRDESYSEPANLLNALIHSDNIYFAQTALEIGQASFASETKNLGIGEKIPFEYGLTSSQISSTGSISTDIQLADSGYGQAQVLMNPVQLASIYTAFVNGGNIITPYLNSTNTSKVWKKDVFSSDTAGTILNDLTQVVANPEGTGNLAYNASIPLAGKTGTAEIKASQTDTTGTENGWFVAVNTNDPKLLVLEMVQDVKNRGGSKYVVPKVKDIFQQFCK